MDIPRTASAPLGQAAFRPTSSAPYGNPTISFNAEGKRATPPPSIPMPTPSAKVAAAKASPNTALPPTASKPSPAPTPGLTSANRSPQPEGAAAGRRTLADLDPVWANAMQTATTEAGPQIMEWAKSCWDTLKCDDSQKPEHLFERRETGIFGGQPAGSTKRHLLVKERTLPHQVMGILSRVTPDNYDAIQQELMNLPIRQSEDAEVTEIVNVFFKKAIRPEDSIYAPQYARLISALVTRIEAVEREKESERGISKVIRSAVVNKCKEQYENMPELRELHQQASTNTDDVEVEIRRRELMAKLKANIGFLGQLFVNRLVTEKVVLAVLYSLLWRNNVNGQPDYEHIQDYEVEHFFTLLEVCGPKLSQNARDTYQAHYISGLNEIANHPAISSTRTKVLAMNCKDLIENGFVRRGKRAGPMKLEDYNRQAAEQQVRDIEMVNRTIRQQQQQQQHQPQQQAAHQPGSVLRRKTAVAAAPQAATQPAPSAPAAPRLMSYNDFRTALDAALKNKTPIPNEVNHLDEKTRVKYFVDWATRFIETNKAVDERKTTGHILRSAREIGALTRPMFQDFRVALCQNAIKSFNDVPKIFEFFCEMMDSSPDIFGIPCYNLLLKEAAVANPTVSFKLMKKLVAAVNKEPSHDVGAKPATPVAAGGDFPLTATRVHLLPHLLRFTGYTFSEPKPIAEGDGAESDECDDEDEQLVTEREEQDLLEVVSSETSDIELLTYVNFLKSCGINEDEVDMPSGKDPKSKAQALLPEEIKVDQLKNVLVARKVISALFTYARFNKKLMEALLQVLVVKQILDYIKSTAHITAILMEVYETWIELDRKPANSLDHCLDYIFANSVSLANSTTAQTLIEEITKNNDDGAIPHTRARVRK